MTFMDTGDPRYFNRYAYTANDPVNLIDPTGEAFGVASKVVKVAIKGGDIGSVLAGGIADAKTLTGRNVSLGRRLAAGASLATEIFSPVSARDAKAITGAAKKQLNSRGTQVGAIVKTDGSTKATDIAAKSREVGFKELPAGSGPQTFVDEAGTKRVTIKSGSARTPGSENPHVSLRRSNGDFVSPAGEKVSRSSAGNHTPIIDDR